jgi:hypothetical protein
MSPCIDHCVPPVIHDVDRRLLEHIGFLIEALKPIAGEIVL